MHSQGVARHARHGRAPGGIDFDASQAPYYVIHFAPTVTDDDVEGVLTRMRDVWKLREKVVVLCDVSNTSLTPRQRKLVTDELRREQETYARWVDGWATVVRSAVARNTLTALTWMLRPPFEMRVCDSLEDARRWTAQRMNGLHAAR